MGLCDYPSSRAVYAVDLMLKWDSHPDGKGTLHTKTLHPVPLCPALLAVPRTALGYLLVLYV